MDVRWDRWGVPHVYAQSQGDLFFIQGYLHAQDRLWQMDFHRRAGAGRLSELFGQRTLEADRFLRRVGLRRAAREESQGLEAESLSTISAYSRGVNAFLERHRSRLPMEFALLRFRPESWAPVDSLQGAKLMSWGLSLNWDVELFRARFLAELGPEAAARLEPPYPAGHPLTTPPGSVQAESPDYGAGMESALAAFTAGGFSNAWVVSGSRSHTGKPLLANDPHLMPQLPSPWYEMHLECPFFRVAGVSLAGAPGIVIGHNQHIAWGITASLVDTQDIFVERFSGDRPRQYEYRGEWHEAVSVQETIRVKGRRDHVVEEVLSTHHGPIISWGQEGSGRAFALRSALLKPGQMVKAALELGRARDWTEFRAALAHWAAPSVNFLYADVAGNIGYQLAGRTPRRPPGTGIVPLAGWTGDHEWGGFLAQEELPFSYNPAQGYIVNANNKMAEDGPAYIAGEWVDGYRAKRIADLLLSKDKLDPADIQRMHLDTLSLPALELQRLLQGVRASSPEARWALERFLSWDGRVVPESMEAALYQALRLRLFRNLLAPLLGSRVEDFFGTHVHPLGTTSAYQYRGTSLLLGLVRELSGPDKDKDRGAGQLGRDEALSRSLEEAAADVRQRLGTDASRWNWGRLHGVAFRHVLGQGRVLGRLLNRGPYALRGDGDTVHQAAYSLQEPYGATRWLPSYRFIADLADWDRCLSIHVPGQSGQPGSPHYDDLIGPWLRGEYHPMPFSREAVEAAAVTRQSFAPGRSLDNGGTSL